LLEKDDSVGDDDAEGADKREIEDFDGQQMSLTVAQIQPASHRSAIVFRVGCACQG